MRKFILPVLTLALAASQAHSAVLLNEPFTYADGPITTVSSGAWIAHSGTDSGATALNVVSNAAFVNQPDRTGGRADANRLLSSTFDVVADNTSKIFSSYTVNFSALPLNGDTDGSYFAHFKSSTANEFYGRVGATTTGAAAGQFRMSVSNESWSTNTALTSEFPLDLSLNTTYRIVTRLDLATDQTTLWVDPVDESSPSVTATDVPTFVAGSINSYALRQGTSGTATAGGAPGSITVDNLVVADNFADLTPIPEPTTLAALGMAGLALLGRRRQA